ncbi:MAG: DUF86 domain-containing protein [Chloroflexi bacterium]|nr:DUF86 domain-containing protein [Chloroflexota bacterium]
MVKIEVIRKRLSVLDEYLGILRSLQKYPLDEFLANPEHYGSAERFLQLAIETTTDIGNHIISSLGLGEVNWYSDIPALLEEKGYISVELRETWIKVIGFRNILVHNYLEVDRKIVYDVLQNRLDDLEELKKAFAVFL